MKKKTSGRNNLRKPEREQANDSLRLGDFINGDIMSKLREKQKELADAESAKKEAEEAKKKEERRLREKNKSFEELLNESSTDWKNFK
ncbi:YqkE family protein [Actinomycetes bacterium NPDC127524]